MAMGWMMRKYFSCIAWKADTENLASLGLSEVIYQKDIKANCGLEEGIHPMEK